MHPGQENDGFNMDMEHNPETTECSAAKLAQESLSESGRLGSHGRPQRDDGPRVEASVKQL